jgi:hypothetical protein
MDALAVVQKEDARKYAIEFVRRGHHSGMDREEIIRHVAGLVPAGKGFSVDLKSPDITILVEILGRTTGISVIPAFVSQSKFNIRSICESVTGVKQESGTPESAPGQGKKGQKRKAEEAVTSSAAGKDGETAKAATDQSNAVSSSAAEEERKDEAGAHRSVVVSQPAGRGKGKKARTTGPSTAVAP